MQEIFDNAQIFNGVDNSSQADEAKANSKRPPWRSEHFNHLSLMPPSDLTITNVKHTSDLQKVKQLSAVPSKGQTSEEWLKNHSVEYEKLTLKDLLQRGKQVKKAGEGKHLVFDSSAIMEIEYKLNLAIEQYHKRVKWLLDGSKKLFGLVKGSRVGVLIDSSDANTGFGRLEDFQQSLLYLIDEQLQHKKSLCLMSFGTEPESLWNSARDINLRVLEEGRDFVRGLHPSGGCNLLKAFKKIIKVKKLNSILIILGNCPDQTSSVLFDYVQQCLLGRNLPIHAVAYDTSNQLTHDTLQRLAEFSNGRYHCYNSSDNREVYKSFDIQLLLREAQRAIDVISKIKQMKTGMLGDALISIENEISLEVVRLSDARFLPRPPNHHRPLSIETPSFHPCTSSRWLMENGLRAKNLNLYQILSPNAFDPVKDFIPVLRKSVTSKVHEKAMQQFEWHDGSMKNVHVDIAMIFEYQKQLGAAVKTFERRIEWLASGSRKIWGTITEKRVIFLIDTSISNKPYVIHIQHSLRTLLEQQLANKQAFNIIAYGSHPKMWKPAMAKPTPENLQSAWKWVQNLKAHGSRNLLAAFRAAVENSDDMEEFGRVQGVYVLSSGVPDQEEDVMCSYASEVCIGTELSIHSILFTIDDYNELESGLPSRYATVTRSADYQRNLAHATGGRFHWFRETGIIESDDVLLLTCEMEKAVHYSRRSMELVDSVKDRDERRKEQLAICGVEPKKRLTYEKTGQFIEPKPTALTIARQNLLTTGPSKSFAWRAPSRKADLPPANFQPSSSRSEEAAVKAQQEVFYTEKQNAVGVVYKNYPQRRSVRKTVPEPIFPRTEERLSSKEWLLKYGINKMKLRLDRYVKGPACIHKKAKGKETTSKWFCSIFPSVEMKGTVRHIDMQESELRDYEAHVISAIRRYSKRMQWLLSGSRRVFGTVNESSVVFVIDVSGSMGYYMDDLQKQLTSLIWEQLHANCIKFNLIAFSNECRKWQDEVVEPGEAICHDAVQWCASLAGHGGTATIDALQLALSDENVEAVYLVSDGKPDTSVQFTLEKVSGMKRVPVHTVSFNCDDRSADEFMKSLSSLTGGKFHRCCEESNAHLAIHRLLEDSCVDEDDPNLPSFDGEDLRRLLKEINKARRFLTQSRNFRQLIKEHAAANDAKEAASTEKRANRPFYP